MSLNVRETVTHEVLVDQVPKTLTTENDVHLRKSLKNGPPPRRLPRLGCQKNGTQPLAKVGERVGMPLVVEPQLGVALGYTCE